jgi:uncharacterized membrane protein YvbJ
MVYCAKCGTENKDDARYCIKCGAPLYGGGRGRERPEKYEKHEKEEKEEREMCFGTSVPASFWGIFIGAIIIIWGLSMLLHIETLPLIIIALGILILIGVLYHPKR